MFCFYEGKDREIISFLKDLDVLWGKGKEFRGVRRVSGIYIGKEKGERGWRNWCKEEGE